MTSVEFPVSVPREAVPDRTKVLIAWGLLAVALLARNWMDLAIDGSRDPDSEMRLVEVRDFLAGQGWFDLRQLRGNAPDGFLMHWSRLIDLPIALLTLGFSAVVDRSLALLAASAVWPLLLLGPYLFAVTGLARRLAGPEAVLPAIVCAVCATSAFTTYTPGDIDHHNAQIALAGLLTVALIDAEHRPRSGALAGLLAAAMLTIGLETLPMVGLAAAALALAWLFDPQRFAPSARGFGLALPAGLVLARIATVLPADWLDGHCDVASAPYVALALVGGAGLALATVVAPPTRGARLVFLAGVGVAAVAAFGGLNPRCLAGPYAEVDPRIVPIWLDQVAEARNLADIAMNDPRQAFASFLGPALAFGVAAVVCRSVAAERRYAWTLIAILLGGAIVIAAYQLRGINFAALLTAPVAAAIVVHVRQRLDARSPVVAALGLLAAYLLPNQQFHMMVLAPSDTTSATAAVAPPPAAGAGAGAAGAVRPPAPIRMAGMNLTRASDGIAECLSARTMAGTARLPTGIALSIPNLAPSIIAYTPHATVGPPYHRNGSGIYDATMAFRSSDEDAARLIARRGIDYVFVCPADSTNDQLTIDAPDGFLAHLETGALPPWLTRVPANDRLAVWAVDRAKLAATLALPHLADLRGTD